MQRTHIYLLGSGIRGALQFTQETIQALRASRVVYVLHDDTMVLDAVRELCPQVEDLATLYSPGDVRSNVYRTISEKLVAEAISGGPSIAFLVHGHPLFLVSATEYTLELARSKGLRVEMLPAVSSFDTLLCDLEIDYGYGLQLFDSSTLLAVDWQPNPQVPMLIFQLATTLCDKVVDTEPPPQVLRPLVEKLLRTYPPDHLCTVVHSSAFLLERSTKIEVALGNLAECDDIELWKRPTLYVPPAS